MSNCVSSLKNSVSSPMPMPHSSSLTTKVNNFWKTAQTTLRSWLAKPVPFLKALDLKPSRKSTSRGRFDSFLSHSSLFFCSSAGNPLNFNHAEKHTLSALDP